MSGKKMKVEVREGAFDSIPESEREAVMADVMKLFENFDPEDPPGQKVLFLAPGVMTCPRCDGELQEEGPAVDLGEGKTIFRECVACDLLFGTLGQ